MWHLLEDVLGWVAVFIEAGVLKFWNTRYLDPVLSLLITAYILYGVIGRLRETLFIFLQGTPKDVDLGKVETGLLEIENVQSLHHTNIWSLEGEHHVFTTPLKLKNNVNWDELLNVKSG